jgi:hypothetical protein
MYCMLVGELDLSLNYLHLAWAKLADRETEYHAALSAAGRTARGLISNKERHRRVNSDDEVTQRVLTFWRTVDQYLGVKVKVETA